MKTQFSNLVEIKSIVKYVILLLAVFAVTAVGMAYAASPISIGAAASNVTSSMSNLAKLITAGAYVGGFGFAVGAILKFKAHKDNPTQIPVGTPIALIFIAAALIFLPSIFGMAGKTIGISQTGGVTGVTGGF